MYLTCSNIDFHNIRALSAPRNWQFLPPQFQKPLFVKISEKSDHLLHGFSKFCTMPISRAHGRNGFKLFLLSVSVFHFCVLYLTFCHTRSHASNGLE